MTWLQPLREPIKLKDGRRLGKLADVHELLDELPTGRKQDGHWQLTERLLDEAAKDSTNLPLRRLQEQLCRALAFDKMI
jgi:hypothetical protein